MTEHVADYPRPPRLEANTRRIRIILGGVTIAETTAAWRVLETFHPPSWYLPPGAFAPGVLRPGRRRRASANGRALARYWTLAAGGAGGGAASAGAIRSRRRASPRIRDHVAVYAGRMEACFVDDGAGDAAARGLLRRLDHRRTGRSLQGRPGDARLVSQGKAGSFGPGMSLSKRL